MRKKGPRKKKRPKKKKNGMGVGEEEPIKKKKTLHCGTPTFSKRCLWDSYFQNPSENPDSYNNCRKWDSYNNGTLTITLENGTLIVMGLLQ